MSVSRFKTEIDGSTDLKEFYKVSGLVGQIVTEHREDKNLSNIDKAKIWRVLLSNMMIDTTLTIKNRSEISAIKKQIYPLIKIEEESCYFFWKKVVVVSTREEIAKNVVRKISVLEQVYNSLKKLDWKGECKEDKVSTFTFPNCSLQVFITPEKIAYFLFKNVSFYNNPDYLFENNEADAQHTSWIIDWFILFLEDHLAQILKRNTWISDDHKKCLKIQIMILQIVSSVNQSTLRKEPESVASNCNEETIKEYMYTNIREILAYEREEEAEYKHDEFAVFLLKTTSGKVELDIDAVKKIGYELQSQEEKKSYSPSP